jgi:hypothetical protein
VSARPAPPPRQVIVSTRTCSNSVAGVLRPGRTLVIEGKRIAAVLTQPEAVIALLMQGGRTVRSRLAALA